MAGKYHRTYLREQVQEAFEEMQRKTGVTSNTYFLEAVENRLRAEGYLAKPKPARAVRPQAVGSSDRSRKRRRRSVA